MALETKLEQTMTTYKNELTKLDKYITTLTAHKQTAKKDPVKEQIKTPSLKYYDALVNNLKSSLDVMKMALNKNKNIAFKIFNPANMPVEHKRMPVTFISPLLNYYSNMIHEASENKLKIELEREPFYEVEETESQFKIPLTLKGKLWSVSKSHNDNRIKGRIAIALQLIVSKKENSKAINVMDIIEFETAYIVKSELLFFFNNDYQYYDDQLKYSNTANTVIDKMNIKDNLDPDLFMKQKTELLRQETNGRHDIPSITDVSEVYSDSVMDGITF
jgi:hypothetical protein